MTDLTITGGPLASFTFYDLPSWNGLVGLHRMKYGAITKAWRIEGFRLAHEFQRFWNLREGNVLVPNKALIIVKCYLPNEGIRDIHNVAIKAVCDGFTDAHIFHDDDWVNVPVVLFHWAGIELLEDTLYTYKLKYSNRNRKSNKRSRKVTRTVIQVHQLNDFIINGEKQILPLGREVI